MRVRSAGQGWRVAVTAVISAAAAVPAKAQDVAAPAAFVILDAAQGADAPHRTIAAYYRFASAPEGPPSAVWPSTSAGHYLPPCPRFVVSPTGHTWMTNCPESDTPRGSRYLIFFDWDGADLSARARQILAEAAQVARSKLVRIEVDGYTDLSASPSYHARLSAQRGDRVAAELMRDGVARGEIAIARRDAMIAHPEAPQDARERRDRRVDIIVR